MSAGRFVAMNGRCRWKPAAIVVIGVFALAILPIRSADPPHWTNQKFTESCMAPESHCHATHSGPGVNLTISASNVNLCLSCHQASGFAPTLPMSNSDRAVPGQQGTSHSFEVSDTSAACGAGSPTSAEMLDRVWDGSIACSTCHDQHVSSAAKGGRPRISPAVKITALASPDITSGGTYTGTNGSWYLIEITTGGTVGNSRFRWSKDNGLTWLGSNIATSTTAISLNSGATVAFPAGTYVLGEKYQFSGSYPFLRLPLDSGDNSTGTKFCRDCHGEWAMDATGVETWNGGSVKSHPVGVALGTGGRTYDRAVPLDGNGATQGGAGVDTISSNDMNVDATNRIQCWTCHGMHYADSITATEDKP